MYQLGLIGYPIKHSLSPWIHEEFLKKSELEGTYSLIEINPDHSFQEAVTELKNSNIDGFNITVPYKQTIIPYLDVLDSSAEKVGAVNTVVNRGGKWIGYNTDGIGYVRSLEGAYPNLFVGNKSDKRILIIGAGGAARGIYYALLTNGFDQIDIANRTAKSALDIAKLKEDSTKTNVLTLEEAEASIKQYDVIIQTTSVGMRPDTKASIVALTTLKEASIVSDIVYQPLETAMLQQAESLGAEIHYGHTMLLYQAQYAFEIWTSKQVELGNMEDELKRILEG